jgi:hypothetical protein
MSRIRTVKPEFFRHEGLQDLEIKNPGKYPMMVFEGLWVLCDKHGCFEWRPRQIKLDILPFLPFDMEETLSILEKEGFIQRYETTGKYYGFVPSFKDHQRIEGKESQAPARYPEPPEKQRRSTGEAPEKHPRSQEREREKEKEKEKEKGGMKTSIPDSFQISDRVKKWAKEKNLNHLEEHLESFKLKCKSKDYKYKDWDAAFMNAIRDNWAKIDNTVSAREPPSSVVSCQRCGARCLKSDLVESGCIYCMNQKEAVQ